MTRQPSPSDYERLPYDGHPDPLIHPERMACAAWLFGVEAVPMRGARILEIGCATGAHLVPMAYQLPEATFVGFDYAPGQIAQANAMVSALGLTNIRFEVRDLRDPTNGLGEFDYILAHGVFSWIPPEVQNQLLELCRRHLATNGVALVDYNVYPGWHLRNIFRDFMMFHGGENPESSAAAEKTLELLDFIGGNLFAPASPYGQVVNALQQWAKTQPGNYLAHEFGAAMNTPILFSDFSIRAQACGLEILGDAQLSHMTPKNLAEKVNARLLGMDYVQSEQTLDFLRGRDFRRTLLVRQGLSVRREPNLEAMKRSYVSTMAQEQPVPGGTAFRCPDGTALRSTDPRSIALMRAICQSGAAGIAVTALLDELQRREVATEPRGDPSAQLLLEFSAVGLVQLHTHAPRVQCRITTKPLANAVARMEAQMGRDGVTSMLQRDWAVDALDRQLLTLLDGTHALEEIFAELAQRAAKGEFSLAITADADRNNLRSLVHARVNSALAWYARAGLLIG